MKLITLKTLSTLALTLCLTSTAQATLFSRLSGQALYDDVLNITWLSNANLALTNQFGLTLSTNAFDDTPNTVGSTGRMTWANANAWIAGMNSANHLGYNDWRLPTMVDTGTSGCNNSFNGTDCGYNVQTTSMDGPPATTVYSEMGSLFYDTLGNNGAFDTSGTFRGGSSGAGNGGAGGDWGLINTGDFSNFQSNFYWSGLEFAPDPAFAWFFSTNFGNQHNSNKNLNFFALAVRPGDVSAVPVPAAVWLMGSALFGLAGFGRKRR